MRNRVTPFGEIVALAGRGTFMGNRGVLHDGAGQIVRAWQVRRWITCVLEFRGRHRLLMQPNRYTELFFLDEAASMSAGHRPCAECRNAEYKRFLALWQGCYGAANADSMDATLHAQRLDGKAKRTYRAPLASLPDGTYVLFEGAPWLLWEGAMFEWTDGGYAGRRSRPARADAEVLTPAASVAVLGAGYRPALHPTAHS